MKPVRCLLLLMFMISGAALAAGNHSGGHQHHDQDMAHWMAPADEAAKPNPVESTTPSINTGRNLYQQHCVACHGQSGKGDGPAGKALNPKPANLRMMAGTHPDGDFAYKIKLGRGAMPGWKQTIADTDVWHLVNFIQSMSNTPDIADVKSHQHDDGHKHEHRHDSM